MTFPTWSQTSNWLNKPGCGLWLGLREVGEGEVTIGLPVRVAFEDLDDSIALPYFVTDAT